MICITGEVVHRHQAGRLRPSLLRQGRYYAPLALRSLRPFGDLGTPDHLGHLVLGHFGLVTPVRPLRHHQHTRIGSLLLLSLLLYFRRLDERLPSPCEHLQNVPFGEKFHHHLRRWHGALEALRQGPGLPFPLLESCACQTC